MHVSVHHRCTLSTNERNEQVSGRSYRFNDCHRVCRTRRGCRIPLMGVHPCHQHRQNLLSSTCSMLLIDSGTKLAQIKPIVNFEVGHTVNLRRRRLFGLFFSRCLTRIASVTIVRARLEMVWTAVHMDTSCSKMDIDGLRRKKLCLCQCKLWFRTGGLSTRKISHRKSVSPPKPPLLLCMCES